MGRRVASFRSGGACGVGSATGWMRGVGRANHFLSVDEGTWMRARCGGCKICRCHVME